MSTLQNIDRLIIKLNRLGVDTKSYLKTSINKQMRFVQGEAKLLCPVGATGYLRNSIIVDSKVTNTGITGICSTNVEYAAYVEFGTGPVGAENHAGISPNVDISYREDGWCYMNDKGEYIYTKGQPAQPFMYPALKNNEDTVLKEIEKDLEREYRRLCND